MRCDLKDFYGIELLPVQEQPDSTSYVDLETNIIYTIPPLGEMEYDELAKLAEKIHTDHNH